MSVRLLLRIVRPDFFGVFDHLLGGDVAGDAALDEGRAAQYPSSEILIGETVTVEAAVATLFDQAVNFQQREMLRYPGRAHPEPRRERGDVERPGFQLLDDPDPVGMGDRL